MKYNKNTYFRLFFYPFVPILVVLLLGLTLRLFGIDWDQGYYLHPDERFLAMVTSALRLPVSISTYFDPAVSPLNPYNNNFSFFVYGRFPIILVRILMELFQMTSYFDVRVIGRILSALADTSVIAAVYLIARHIMDDKGKRRFPLYAALCYAVFVFPIQQAHFFTSDSLVSAFFIWAVYFALRQNIMLTAILCGLGIATKMNFLYGMPLVIFLLMTPAVSNIVKSVRTRKGNFRISNFGFRVSKYLANCLLFTLLFYLSLRLSDPYLFRTSNFFDIRIGPQVLANLVQLKSLSSSTVFYPPSIQWIGKDFLFSLKNIIFYGIGPLFSVLSFMGLIRLARHIKQGHVNHSLHLFFILIWCIAFFAYQSAQFAKTMRYFLFLYPFFALMAGYFLSLIVHRLTRAIMFFVAFIWTIAFMHIYTVPHSRVQASYWMHTFFSDKSTTTWEYWDDPLPLIIPNGSKQPKQISLDIYQPDSKEKWKLIAKKLQYADYVILSSNRLWGSIPGVPELYPYASRYYKLLFQNKLGFTLVKEFSSYPTISIWKWKFKMDDDNAEEAFTVYDHPKVLIYRRTSSFNPEKFLRLITQH